MLLENLCSGPLLGRRKRFFADVQLPEGPVVAHCPNTGSMQSLLIPGTEAILSRSNDPKRKLAFTLEALQLPSGAIACVNTQRPNHLVAEAIAAGRFPEFPIGSFIEKEVVLNAETRFDLRVTAPGQSPCWIEVKNVTLMEVANPGIASFPDAVTTRGSKHLRELAELARQGQQAAMCYLVNRDDTQHFKPARTIDPEYARGLELAVQAGVHIWVWQTTFTRHQDSLKMEVTTALPWSLT